jgi:hypothetical protein
LALRGDLYVATTRYVNVANTTGKVSLLIKNPIGSGKKLSIHFIIDSEGKLVYRSYSGYTVTASTPVVPLSLLIPQKKPCVAQVYKEVAFTGGTIRADDLMPFGTGGTARGGSSDTVINILEEGAKLLVELTNDSGKAIGIGFKVEIAELIWG